MRSEVQVRGITAVFTLEKSRHPPHAEAEAFSVRLFVSGEPTEVWFEACTRRWVKLDREYLATESFLASILRWDLKNNEWIKSAMNPDEREFLGEFSKYKEFTCQTYDNNNYPETVEETKKHLEYIRKKLGSPIG